MTTEYKAPGVYIEEIARFPPSIAPVETAIPAFIGYTEKADDVTAGDLHLIPTRITSLVEYERYFGKAQLETAIKVTITHNTNDGTISRTATLAEASRSKHILYYAMQMFFANGGGPCYIVSVGPFKTLGTDLDEGELELGLKAIKTEDEITLIVFPEAQNLTSLSKFGTLHDLALAQCAELQNRFTIMDIHGGTHSLSDPATFLLAVADFRNQGIGINNLKYGAAYAPNIATILAYAYDKSQTQVTIDGAMQMMSAVNDQSLQLAMAAIADMALNLPPSSTMAGIYASVDNSRGVWKAPANVSIINVIEPIIPLTSSDQETMNVDALAGKSVNAIRAFTGRGTLVWGARTLAGNDNEWRYVNVRRFFIFVEQSTKNATQQFVFESNDANTWVKTQGMIENFLTTQWRQGALQGIKPEHAFYVSVGLGKTMTALDILEGRMYVEIGMAAVRPAEFIILRFSHKMAES
jgi:phage tail sheath protein FI